MSVDNRGNDSGGKELSEWYPDAVSIAKNLMEGVNMGMVLDVWDYDSGLFIAEGHSNSFTITEKTTGKEYAITVEVKP